MTMRSFFGRILSYKNVTADPGAWFRARMTQVAAALLLLGYFLPETITIIKSREWDELWLVLSASLVLILAMWLARTGYHAWSGWLVVLAWTVDILLDAGLSERVNVDTLSVMLILGLALAFLLLELRDYVFFAVAQLALAVIALSVRQVPVAELHISLHFLAAISLGIGVWLRMHARRERDVMQAALSEQAEYLQHVIDAVQAPFYAIDAKNYRIKLANRAARETGLLPDATTCYGLTHGLFSPCSGKEHPCPLQHVMQSREPFVTEHIHHRADGEPYYAEVHGYPVFNEKGEVVQMVEYSLDISERKKAEAEIRKLKRAVEFAASGVGITDPDGVFEYVNPAFEKITGYTRDELLGKTPNVLKSGRHSPEFYRELWNTVEAGQVWQGEMINRRKDGTFYWEFQTIAPVLENGKITHYIAIKMDISRQKQLEEELREAKENAEAASAMKSRLLANVSHDMRTPLGGIMGFAEMLLSGVYGEIRPEQAEPLKNIIESAQSLANFVNGMLTRAELESGKLKLQPHVFSPEDLLDVLSMHVQAAQRKGLQVEKEVDPRLPAQLYGDTYWLEQILVNLFDNAVKYTPAGKVTVRLQRVDESRWAMEVQDEGIGIAPELHEHIFNAFVQVDSGPGKQIEGIGLGLSIVRELANAMGGEIHLESSPGEGSRFTVIFPIEELKP